MDEKNGDLYEPLVPAIEASQAKRFALKKNVFDRWVPKKVRIASFEQGGAMLTIRWANFDGGNVSDTHWGKAVCLSGAFPIKIREDGKEVGGFLVNGDKGVAIRYKEDTDLFGMWTTGELAWSLLDTKKITDAFTADPTFRTKMMFFLMGVLPMALMWWLSGA
jgi:hypothetical protein